MLQKGGYKGKDLPPIYSQVLIIPVLGRPVHVHVRIYATLAHRLRHVAALYGWRDEADVPSSPRIFFAIWKGGDPPFPFPAFSRGEVERETN